MIITSQQISSKKQMTLFCKVNLLISFKLFYRINLSFSFVIVQVSLYIYECQYEHYPSKKRCFFIEYFLQSKNCTKLYRKFCKTLP